MELTVVGVVVAIIAFWSPVAHAERSANSVSTALSILGLCKPSSPLRSYRRIRGSRAREPSMEPYHARLSFLRWRVAEQTAWSQPADRLAVRWSSCYSWSLVVRAGSSCGALETAAARWCFSQATQPAANARVSRFSRYCLWCAGAFMVVGWVAATPSGLSSHLSRAIAAGCFLIFILVCRWSLSLTRRCCEPRATPSDYSVTSGSLGSPGVRGR